MNVNVKRLVFALSLSLLSTACSSGDLTVTGEPPADADWWAVIVTSVGEFSAASPLMSTEGGPPYRASVSYPEADLLTVVAYRDDDLTTVAGFPPQPAELALPLQGQGAAGGRLPEPRYVTNYSLEGMTLDDGGEPPPLSAPWLDPCPQIIPPGETYPVHETCFLTPCKVSGRQDQCTLTLDARECADGSISGQLDATADVEFDASTRFEACRVTEPQRGGIFSVACESKADQTTCNWEVLEPTQTEEPMFSVERVIVGAERTFEPADEPTQPRALNDLALLDGRTYVVRFTSPTSYQFCENTSTEIFVFDDGMQEVDRFPGQPCLTQIEADPTSGTLVGTHFDQSGGLHLLSRFGLDGRIIDTTTIADVAGKVRIDFAVSLQRNEIAVAFASATGEVHFFELQTLAPISGSTYVGRNGIASVVATGDDFATIDNGADSLIINLRTSPEVHSTRDLCGRGNLRRVGYNASTGRYPVWTAGPLYGLFSVDLTRGECPHLKALESVSQPGDFGTWPANPSWMVVGLDEINSEQETARIALADLDQGRFIPGSQFAGRGFIEGMKADGAGAVWAIGVYESSLLRIAPSM